jgi:hypothetical protein
VSVYAVYEPPVEAADLESRAEGLVFVRDGFSWGALLVPGIWLVFRGMWLELCAFLLLFGLLAWLFGGSAGANSVFGWTALAIVVLFAFEANDLRGAALERRGYRLVGLATGPDRDSAELSFFRAWLPEQEREGKRPLLAERGRIAPAEPAGKAAGDGEEVIGLFPRP